MHSDDHILEHFLAGKHPLPALATHLGVTLIALVQWVDRNADLLATARRAMEAHIAFLALKAEAAALIDLTSVSSSTTNEERKRKSSSQLLRHSAKRLLTAVGSSSSFSPQVGEKVPSTERARGMRGSPSAHSTNSTRERGAPSASASSPPLINQLASPPSPRSNGEKVPSTEGARGMRGSPSAHSTNPTRERDTPPASASSPPLINQLASPPSPRLRGEKVPSTEGARGMRGDESFPLLAPSLPNAESRMPNACLDAPMHSSSTNAEPPTPNPASSSFSDHEVDAMMAALAMHFNIDVKSLFTDDDPVPAALADG